MYLHKTRIVLIILGIILSSIFFLQIYQTEHKEKTIVFLLDISHSMNTLDEESFEGQKISRLTKAKEIINEVIDSITIYKIGLIVFTQKANYYIPPSLDHQKIKTSTHIINSNILINQGSDINQALNYAKSTETENQITILLTDGGEGDDIYTGSLVKKLIIIPIGSTQGGNIRNPDGTIFTDKNGQQHFSKLNEKKLEELAKTTDTLVVSNSKKNIIREINKDSYKLGSNTSKITLFLLVILVIIGL